VTWRLGPDMKFGLECNWRAQMQLTDRLVYDAYR
jgi:hypothetical protein